ncbi:hypothetical protein TNCV_2555491 [Trichonephila clavipes]|nr:hypothetical protein TNCV_2555491 [Trichonephila clavipes]
MSGVMENIRAPCKVMFGPHILVGQALACLEPWTKGLYSPKIWKFRTICQLTICDGRRTCIDLGLSPCTIITHSVKRRQSVKPVWGANNLSKDLRSTFVGGPGFTCSGPQEVLRRLMLIEELEYLLSFHPLSGNEVDMVLLAWLMMIDVVSDAGTNGVSGAWVLE